MCGALCDLRGSVTYGAHMGPMGHMIRLILSGLMAGIVCGGDIQSIGTDH